MTDQSKFEGIAIEIYEARKNLGGDHYCKFIESKVREAYNKGVEDACKEMKGYLPEGWANFVDKAGEDLCEDLTE